MANQINVTRQVISDDYKMTLNLQTRHLFLVSMEVLHRTHRVDMIEHKYSPFVFDARLSTFTTNVGVHCLCVCVSRAAGHFRKDIWRMASGPNWLHAYTFRVHSCGQPFAVVLVVAVVFIVVHLKRAVLSSSNYASARVRAHLHVVTHVRGRHLGGRTTTRDVHRGRTSSARTLARTRARPPEWTALI